MSVQAVVIKKSLLPHPILRDLHSDIELMLTNCRKEENKRNQESKVNEMQKSGECSKEKVKPLVGKLVDVEHHGESNLVVKDGDTNLVIFCRTLEKAFRHGMADYLDKIPKSFDYFEIFCKLAKETKAQKDQNYKLDSNVPKLSLYFCRILEELENKPGCLLTSSGKGRFILRYCLSNLGLLLHLIDSLQMWSNVESVYRHDALVRQKSDDSSTMTLRGLVQSLSTRCRFELELSNKAFLDSSWELPELRKIELVPCKDLGLMICPIRGYIIVTKVKTYSVAGEDHKVEVGDILDELDGVPLFGTSPESIAKKVKKAGGKVPISLGVIKSKSFGSNFIFSPISPLLSEAGLDVHKLEETKSRTRIRFKERSDSDQDVSLLSGHQDPENDDEHESEYKDEVDGAKEVNGAKEGVGAKEVEGPRNLFMAKNGHHLTYIGSLQIGRIDENNSFMDHAISRVVNAENKVDHEVSLHILEFGVRLYCRRSGKQVLYYPYPKISACGVSSLNPKYLSFIGAEDDVCSLAKKFLCHVFFSDDRIMSKQIVSSMAAGFDRTISAA